MTWPTEGRIIPVITILDAEDAVPLARALQQGGLAVVEVTLRSSAALSAVSRVRQEAPDVVCGVGTVRSTRDVEAAASAGAQFLVSPGSTVTLLDAMVASGLPSLPGAATPSEAMTLSERGFTRAKFFPAESNGGVSALKALAGPFPDLLWCATGGVTPANASAYLALPNVFAVGGSWMVSQAAVSQRNWGQIARLAGHTAQLIPKDAKHQG